MNFNWQHSQVIFDIFHMSKNGFCESYAKEFFLDKLYLMVLWDGIRENINSCSQNRIIFTNLSEEHKEEIKKEILQQDKSTIQKPLDSIKSIKQTPKISKKQQILELIKEGLDKKDIIKRGFNPTQVYNLIKNYQR